MKFFLFTIIIFIFLFLHISAQDNRSVAVKQEKQERRIALVIGNSAYADAPLRNPANDAMDMAAALKELGFEVILKTDLDQNEMKRSIREFGQRLRDGSVGLFYYAGHGVQVKGINYLIPVGANANSEEEIEYEGVEAGFVLAQMEAAKNSMNFVILDACRNNPFARSYRSDIKGLAQMNAPRGSLIAYSTAPGSVAMDGFGRNGTYTAELLKKMRIAGLDIKEVFQQVRVSVLNLTRNKQTPWESYSLTDNFYFKGKPNSLANSAERELSFWDSIKNSTDPQDFKEYIDRYPKGQFVGIATRRLQSLGNARPGESVNSATPARPKKWTVENSFFIFELQGCKLSGTKVSCDLIVINNDRDRNMWLGYMNTFLFDDFNNKVEASHVQLANSSNNFMSASAETFLVKGIRTPARVVFENVSLKATVAPLITISMGADNIENFKIEYRNIPLTEQSRSLIDSGEKNGESSDPGASDTRVPSGLKGEADLSGVWTLADQSDNSLSKTFSIFYDSGTGELFYDAKNSCGIGKIIGRELVFDYFSKDAQAGGKLILRIKDSGILIGRTSRENENEKLIELRKSGELSVESGKALFDGTWRNPTAGESNSAKFVIRQAARYISYQAEKSEGKGVVIGNRAVMLWNQKGSEKTAGILELTYLSANKLKGFNTFEGQRFDIELTR